MSTAIAIYLTGAVAWFGGMGLEADVDAMRDRDHNPFNNATRRMQTMLCVSALWPFAAAVGVPGVLWQWATSKRHGKPGMSIKFTTDSDKA